jgi:glycerophosphoryl diester phosphodiesterase
MVLRVRPLAVAGGPPDRPSSFVRDRGMTRTLVIAHRGASTERPENTLLAFARAMELGADLIELDVRRTRDGRLVAFHDLDLAGTPLARMTAADAQRRVPHRLPRLDEVLDLARGNVRVNLELKEDGYVADVVKCVREWPADALLLTSFLEGVVTQLKRLRPDVEAGLLVDDLEGFVARALACGADMVGLDRALADDVALDDALAAGLGAFVWTVNDDDDLRRHLGDERVLAVVTDCVARALELRDVAQAGGVRARRARSGAPAAPSPAAAPPSPRP